MLRALSPSEYTEIENYQERKIFFLKKKLQKIPYGVRYVFFLNYKCENHLILSKVEILFILFLARNVCIEPNLEIILLAIHIFLLTVWKWMFK